MPKYDAEFDFTREWDGSAEQVLAELGLAGDCWAYVVTCYEEYAIVSALAPSTAALYVPEGAGATIVCPTLKDLAVALIARLATPATKSEPVPATPANMNAVQPRATLPPTGLLAEAMTGLLSEETRERFADEDTTDRYAPDHVHYQHEEAAQ